MQDVSLILDVGKTNTKLFLFDASLKIVYERQTATIEKATADGLLQDDLDAVWSWFLAELEKIGREKQFRVRAINATSFGATLVHIDGEGNPLTPIYSYNSDPGSELDEAFNSWFASLPGGHTRHATPHLSHFLIAAKQLFWLGRRHPEKASVIRYSLFLPQYLIYKLSGVLISEATSYGCHTGLWDFEMMAPSVAAIEGLGWQTRIPRLADHGRLCQLDASLVSLLSGRGNIPVGAGMHDAAASLYPYLECLDDPFILITTGTWIIAQNPFARFALSEKDLQQDRLYYLTPQLQPVRAARIFAGQEHERQLQRITEHFGRAPQEDNAELEPLLARFFAKPNEGVLTAETLHGSGPFPNVPRGSWDLSVFSTPEQAYARLCLDLAVMTAYLIDNVAEPGQKRMIVDGGFTRNTWFLQILSMLVQPCQLFIADISNATALGAALSVHHFWVPDFDTATLLELQPIETEHLAGLRVYAEWLIALHEQQNHA